MSKAKDFNLRLSKRRKPDPSKPPGTERINALISVCKANWLVLMSYLAFVGVTLLGVVDLDFFIPERRTQLPLIGVTIPTSLFFYIAPVLGLMLYAHLHFYLMRLWRALSAPDAPRADQLTPWLVVDYTLYLRGRPDGFPLQHLANLVINALIFGGTPIVLFFFWQWSMPKHDPLLTLVFTGGSFFLALLVGVESLWLQRLGVDPGSDRRRSWIGDLCLGAAFVLIPITGFARAVNVWPWPDGPTLWPDLLASAQLAEAEFVDAPDGWLPRDEAEQVFRRKWCEQTGIPVLACGRGPLSDVEPGTFQTHQRQLWCNEHLPPERRDALAECDTEFGALSQNYKRAWNKARLNELALLPRRNLVSIDLRSANLLGARLEAADLPGARLEGAILREARLEGASLRSARLDGADLGGARLEGVNLVEARLEGADLRWARLEGANLRGALLEGAGLLGAHLERADLFWARLKGSNFRGARLEGANLFGAELEGADFGGAGLEWVDFFGAQLARSAFNATRLDGAALKLVDLSETLALTAEQLQSTFGDASVILPDNLRPAPDHWPDWELDGNVFDQEYRRWLSNPATYTPPPKPTN